MILTNDKFLMQNDIVCDRRNSAKGKALYSFICYCENEFADDYGEWFNVKMSDLQSVINDESIVLVRQCLYRLMKIGYIEFAENDALVRIRVRTLEEREEKGLRPVGLEIIKAGGC